MNTITPTQSSQPSFGMAVKFRPGGKKFFRKVIADNPTAGDEFIKRQSKNKSSNITVARDNVFVDIDGKNWRILGSIFSPQKGRQSFEEMLFSRQANVFRTRAYKTLIKDVEEPLAYRYGGKGRKFAIAEDIANYEAFKYDNKRPPIIARLSGLFKND